MITSNEKHWEDYINKSDSENKITKKEIADLRKIKEEQKKIIEKMGNNFCQGIEEEKNKSSFYR